MSNSSVMPMPPCIWTASWAAKRGGGAGPRLGGRHDRVGIVEIRVERLQRLEHDGAGDLDLGVEMGGAMLQCLELADGA